ncbi:MAG TPA: hypothetical protein ENJ28_04980 [Gammaproteobacteria bacterium]|nr:hypothetical protein [Gammaproteobacteria bacterium]
MNTPNAAAPTAETVSMQDIEKKYFPPEQLEAGSNYINEVMEICSAENVEPVFNFDTDGEFPDGYGLSIIPLTKRIPERGNSTYGVVIAAVPTVELLASEEAGTNYINKIVTDSLLKQIAAGAKPRDEGAQIAIPFKLEEFTTTSRSSGLAAFNLVASDYVKALKTKGLKFMSKPLLRQVLSSAQFAEQQFPRITQENWQVVLNSMMQHVKAKGVDTGVLNHWLNTRDEVEIDVTDIDLTDLDSMI